MAHILIEDLKPGQSISDIYMVTQPVLRHTTKGDLYIAMYLSDRTGKVNARMWQATEAIYNELPSEGFIHIQGKSELYQNALQIVVNNLTVVDSDKVNLADYMPRTDKDIQQLFREVVDMLSDMDNEDCRALIKVFLEDKALMKEFCTAPAAMQMHHAYLGGLLEHTHNMLRVAKAVLPLYPKVQGDIVLAAIFLHDLAKTKELSYTMGISYTNRGQLVGHLVQGAMMVREAAAKLPQAMEEDVLNHLLHIMVSHHGSYEFGSPKLPATAEAFMVNYIDDLDAKMNQVANLIEADPGNSDWTAYHRSLETKLFKRRPLLDE